MICRGVQIVAARGLLRWSQMDLAEAAGLHRNAVAYWEGVERIAASKYPPYAVRRIQGALERAGVKTFATPTPGVALASTGRRKKRAEVCNLSN